MKLRRWISLLALLSGCHPVGPDYQVPEKAIVKSPAALAPFSASELRITSPQPVPGQWWRLYRDPVLDDLVEESLSANTDLRIGRASIARAAAGLKLAEDARLPQTGVSAEFARTELSGEQYLETVTLPPMNLYDVDFTASYQLDIFGQIKRGIEAARDDHESAQAAYDVVQITVAAETARAYADACSAGEELLVTGHILDLQRQNAALTARLVAGGRGTVLDLARARGAVDTTQASIPGLRAQHQIALFRLATLAGRPPDQYSRDAAKCETAPRLRQIIPVGDGAALLRRRPDIRRAERALAGATARIGVAIADLYPKISLGLNLESIGAAQDFLKSDTNSYALGPLLQWEFPNISATRAHIAATRAAAAASYAQFDGTVLTALREVESALTIYAQDLDREQSLKSAQARAATALKYEIRLQTAGRETITAVLMARQILAADDQAVAVQDVTVAHDQIALFLALGGGWEKTDRE